MAGKAFRRRAGLIAAGAATCLLAGCGSGGVAASRPAATPAASDSYGALPTYLPSAGPVDQVLVGTAARPDLTTEGDQVEADLGGTTVAVTVTGPEVPGEGLPNAPETAPCTWTVTLSGATAPVTLRVADFSTLDHLGNVNHPQPISGRPAPPAVLNPGESTTFELRATMVVGEGVIRWAPGGHTLASWDFEVEND